MQVLDGGASLHCTTLGEPFLWCSPTYQLHNSRQVTRGLQASISSSEKEAWATHSSILAWRIPWTEEPGGLQSMGSQRVGRD